MIFEENENYTLHLGDCLDILDTIGENSIDCIITDPPYELNFMLKDWDGTGIVYRKELWEKCLRVLKPGGYLLCFGAPRNFHRVFCAIEDAGFEIRDIIMWIFGSLFPKGQDLGKSIEAKLTLGSGNKQDFKHLNGDKTTSNAIGYSKMHFDHGDRPEHYTGKETVTNVKLSNSIAKQYEGWNSTLKPAYEPIMVARKPFKGSLTENVINYGVGGLNIDECRIDFINDKDKKITVDKNQYWDKSDAESDIYSKYEGKRDYTEKLGGRYPSNVILTYNEENKEEVCSGFPNSKSTGGKGEKTIKSGLSGNVYNGGWSHEKASDHIGGLGDEGSNARFFKNCQYTEKDEENYRTKLDKGRYPANIILTYDENNYEEVCGGFPQSGNGKGGKPYSYEGREYNNKETSMFNGDKPKSPSNYNDRGSASRYFKNLGHKQEDYEDIRRYFYCPKASKTDRNEGLDNFPEKTDGAKGHGLDRVCEFCGVSQLTPEKCKCKTKSWITKPKKNTHPTVKPTSLLKYLIRLVAPKNAIILDPFNGSGSTGKAVMLENKERNKNYKYIGIDLSQEYLEISKGRIDYILGGS